jgi:hypothetical protein
VEPIQGQPGKSTAGGLALLSEHAKSDKIIQMILDVVSTRAHMDVLIAHLNRCSKEMDEAAATFQRLSNAS